MASKNNAIENFEEWRKNKASAEEPTPEVLDEVVTPQEVPVEPQLVEPQVAGLSTYFATAVAALVELSRAGVARFKLKFAPQDKTEMLVSIPTVQKEQTKSLPSDKSSLTFKLKNLPAAVRAKYNEASARNKKITLASALAAALFVIAVILLVKFEIVTPDAGIKTSLGSAKGHSVIIEKGASIATHDLIVAVQPGSPEDSPELIIGTVFSSNEETYALYDGEVIWQIPIADLKGKVLFAEATQKLP